GFPNWGIISSPRTFVYPQLAIYNLNHNNSDMVNGVKTVNDQIHSLCQYWDILIMGSRPVAKQLLMRPLVSNQQTEELPNLTSINPRNETTSDAKDEDITSTCAALPNLPPSGSTSNKNSTKKKTKDKQPSSSSTVSSKKRSKGKKPQNKPQGILHAIVDEEFPPIQNHMAQSNLEDSESNDNSSYQFKILRTP
ncbi:hypothetical protein VP01_8066g1, partial [Puccinia sorghi]